MTCAVVFFHAARDNPLTGRNGYEFDLILIYDPK